MVRTEIIGNLGAEAEVKEFGEDKEKYVSMSVAVTDKDKDTTWWSVLKRGDGGGLLQYLKKGTKVFLRGEPVIKMYQDKHKEHHISFNMYASEIYLCGEKEHKSEATGKNEKLPF